MGEIALSQPNVFLGHQVAAKDGVAVRMATKAGDDTAHPARLGDNEA